MKTCQSCQREHSGTYIYCWRCYRPGATDRTHDRRTIKPPELEESPEALQDLNFNADCQERSDEDGWWYSDDDKELKQHGEDAGKVARRSWATTT